MAIDRMKKITLLCPAACTQRLLKSIHDMALVEVTDTLAQHEELREQLQRQPVSTEEPDQHLQKINLVLGLLDLFAPEHKSFVAGLAPVPMVIETKELDEVMAKFDLESVYGVAQELDTAHRHTERGLSDIQNQLRDLAAYEDLPFSVSDLGKTERTRLYFGMIVAKNLDALAQDAEAARILAWGTVVPGQFNRKNGSAGAPPAASGKAGDRTRVVFACLKDDEETARKLMNQYGFEEVSLPHVAGLVRDHIRELKADLAEFEEQAAKTAARVRELAVHRRALQVQKAFWENRKALLLARGNSAQGKWIQVLTGYLRAADAPALEEAIRKEFPTVSVLVEDPGPDDNVPVSISLPKLIRPIQMLINLFGLPPYTTFDPSPFIFFPFLLFFGICFSDVGYGAMLIAVSLYIMKKTKPFDGVYNFAKLLFYGGISTVIFGFVLGSLFGDLYAATYLGAGNPVEAFMKKVQLIDPLQKPIVVLMFALAIGMCNQFYGIVMKMYGHFQRGEKADALCDGLTWLIILPGFVILVAGMFAPVPGAVSTAGLVLFGVGAIALILTQGRASEGLVGKISTGVISLYGIVGSYGLTAFLGDTMSYCRLLALALTTGIVALSFNMMAALLRDIPYVGFPLFIFVLVFAHVFNFMISGLGAFVHSMRLIFVEFFGRFYASGGKPFTPLGFDSGSAILKRSH